MNPSDSAPRSTSWQPASLKEAGLLLLFCLAATAGSWALRPDGLSLRADPTVYQLELAAPLVSLDEALALFEEGDHLFIDTRSEDVAATGIIAGAFFIRESSFDDDLYELFDIMLPEDGLVLYGDGNLSAVSNLATLLLERGYTNLLILESGIAAWQAAGGDVSPGGAP
jgi:rhodanese-related sulfurtransferase